MCQKCCDWLYGQFRTFNPMHWIFGIALSNALLFTVGVIAKMTALQICVSIFLFSIAFLSGMSLWMRRGERGANFFLQRLDTIPGDEADEKEWKGWIDKERASLRGRGMKRKADILAEVVGMVDSSVRREAAENFFRGAAQEYLERFVRGDRDG